MEDNNPLVSVLCLTYNQVGYIEQMLNSILSQVTNFSFEVLIHDDASTDGTLNILNEYARKYPCIRCFPETVNQNDNRELDYVRDILLPCAAGKYIAFCEGDDYWIDTYKLQKQVDLMSRRSECSMVCGRAVVIDGVTGDELGDFGYGPDNLVLSFEDLLGHWEVPTGSTFFRKSDAFAYYSDWTFPKPVGDFPRAAYLASIGQVYYLGDYLTAYRYSVPGSWTTDMKRCRNKRISNSIQWLKMLFEIDCRLKEKYHDVIVRHGVAYAVQLKALLRDLPKGVPLLEECLDNIGLKSYFKLMVISILDSLKLQLVKVRWSGLIKWKIERVR